MDDENYFVMPIHVACPTCGSPVVIEGFHWRLHFPSDDQLIASVLEGRLNVSECPVCQEVANVLTPFLAIHNEKNRCLVVEGLETFADVWGGSGREAIEKLLPGKNLTYCEDYDELRSAMLPWVLEEIEHVAVLTITGEVARMDAAQRMPLVSRTRLRLLRMVADEVLTMALQLPPRIQARMCHSMGAADVETALRKLWPQQVDGLVFQLLQDEFEAAVQAGGLADLPARIERRVGGSPIVTDRVRQWCLDECAELQAVADDAEKFDSAYRAHFLNAIAHQLTAQPNPAGASWSAFLWFAFHASRKGVFADTLLPSVSDAARLVRFEDLWNRCAPALRGEPKEFEAALQDTRALMERLGHTDRLLTLLQTGPTRWQVNREDAAEKQQGARRAVIETLKERFPFPLDDDRRQVFAAVSAGQVRNLVLSGLPDAAAHVAQDVVQYALDAADYVAAFDVGVKAVAHLAAGELFDEAVDVIEPLMNIFATEEVTAQLGKVGADLTVGFWNEAGNVLRQRGHREQALQSYALARNFLELVDEHRKAALESVISTNEARVFRDQGRFSEARRRLEEAVRRAPGDVDALHSLALLHLQLNEHRLARACVDRALANPDVALEPLKHARLLQTRGMAWAGAGQLAEGLQDFSTALDIAPEEAPELVTHICVSIAMTAPGSNHPVLERAKARLLAVLRGDVQHAASRGQRSLHATVLAAYGDLLIAEGTDDAIRNYLDEWLGPFVAESEGSALPWQLLAVRGRVAVRLEGPAAAWPWLERALVAIDADSPAGKDPSAVLGWMRDKHRFQLDVADAAIRVVRDGHIPPDALLPIVEFTIGRSTSAKLAAESVFEIAERVAGRLAEASAGTVGTIHVVAFLEGRDEVQGFVISAGDTAPRILAQAHFPANELRILQSRFADVLVSANPKNPSRLDARLPDWFRLARTLGSLLAAIAEDEDVIAFLPCSSLAGLPLHLCPVDAAGTTLIERHPVVYAGNFGALLSRTGAPNETGGRLIVAVSKAQDRQAFQDALRAAAERLAAARPAATRVLAGTEASLSNTLAALRACDEAWFLCHGAYGGREAGFALCLSDGAVLPPSLLSIDEAPSLKRFTLDWTDLESLDRAPALLVSIPCSSGRTLIDAGGSRLGIEQALLAKGTQAIISPQWDVDQDAALAWLDAFDAGPPADPSPSPASRCRHAATIVRERFDHWYFWGAFAFTGSIFPVRTSGGGVYDRTSRSAETH
jgi:tetratricopeptide (TPR) repeat protein/CHAT domain-containing protein